MLTWGFKQDASTELEESLLSVARIVAFCSYLGR